MKRRLFLWGLATLSFLTTLGIFVFCEAGYFLDAPAQMPEKSDLIVALGGDNGSRINKAAELYKQGFAPNVLLTGLEGSDTKTRSNYLNWRASFLVEQGVPAEALIFDVSSASSWDEAVNTLHLMNARGLNLVTVVSDPPHLRRLDWVWGKVFAGSGKEYRLVAAPMAGWNPGRWWQKETSAQFVIMEYIKLGYYSVIHL